MKNYPLFKCRGPKTCNNYTPITISIILSKIMERIVHRQTIDVCRSTSRLITYAVFIDLRKLFDTVDHAFLIVK